MADLTVTPITKTGVVDITAAMVAADIAGDQAPSSSGIFLAVTNGDAGAHTVTVTAPAATVNCGNLGELTVEDIVLSVGAGATAFLAVPLGYSDVGFFKFAYDAVASVTVGVFSIAP